MFSSLANQLPAFSISRIANVGGFFNVNVFFKCKLKINISINNHSLYLCSLLLETSFLLSHLVCNIGFELIRLIEVQNQTNIEIIGFYLMHFGFVLDSWNVDSWDIDLLDTDLDLLVGHGEIQISPVNILFVSKTSSRHAFKSSSRHVFNTSLRHVFHTSSRHVFNTSSRHVFHTSSRHVFNTFSRRLQRNNFLYRDSSSRRLQDVFKKYLQDVFKTSWKTKNCYAEGVLKTSSRHVLKTSSRRLEGQQMFARIWLQYLTKSATRWNDRNDLLHLSFTLKASIFSEAYI